MPDEKQAAAEPSSAATTEFPGVGQLTSAQKAAWNKSVPTTSEEEPKPKTQEAAPADAPKEAKSEATDEITDPVVEAETEAEAEAAKPQESKDKPRGRKPGAEERISQLTREKRELEEALRKAQAAPKPPSTEAKAEPAAETTPVEAPKRPNPFTWTGTAEDYDKAMETYESHLKQQAVNDAFRQHAAQETQKEMQKHLDEANTRYGADAGQKIVDTADTVFKDQAIPAAVKALIDASPVITDLMYVLSEPAKLAEFVKTARTNPAQALREVVVTEQLIQQELNGGKKTEASRGETAETEEEAESSEKPAEKKPTPVIPVTRAQKPLSEVGGRGTAPEDSLVAAAQAGTSRTGTSKLTSQFKAEATRRYAAAHK